MRSLYGKSKTCRASAWQSQTINSLSYGLEINLPSISAAHPAIRASRRDRKTFMVSPLNLLGRPPANVPGQSRGRPGRYTGPVTQAG